MGFKIYPASPDDARNLTTVELQGFVGGQLDILSCSQSYHFRCQIETVEIVGRDLRVTFSRVLKDLGNGQWIEGEVRPYSIETGTLIPGKRTDDKFPLVSLVETEDLTFYSPESEELVSVVAN